MEYKFDRTTFDKEMTKVKQALDEAMLKDKVNYTAVAMVGKILDDYAVKTYGKQLTM